LFLSKLVMSLDMQVSLARSSVDLCHISPDSSLLKAMEKLSLAVNIFRLEIETTSQRSTVESPRVGNAVDAMVPYERSSRDYQDFTGNGKLASKGHHLQVQLPKHSGFAGGASMPRSPARRNSHPRETGSNETSGADISAVQMDQQSTSESCREHQLHIPETQLQLLRSQQRGSRPSEEVMFVSSRHMASSETSHHHNENNVKFELSQDSGHDRASGTAPPRQSSFHTERSDMASQSTVTRGINRMDSLQSTLVEDNPKIRCPDGTINPNWGLRMMWDLFVILLVLVDAMVLPYQMAYPSGTDEPSFIDTFWLYLTTIFFAIDIFLNFMTAYPASINDVDYEPGKLVTNRIKIARNYLRTWFTIDFISTIPWGVLADVAAGGESGGGTQLAKLTKVIKFVRFLRLMRMLRLAKLGMIWERIEARLGSLVLLQTIALLRVMFVLTAICHWNACIWWIIGQPSDSILTDMMSPEGLDSWKRMIHWTTVEHTTLWVGGDPAGDAWTWLDKSNNEAYIFCFYWTLGVMRTMPAEVQPTNKAERIYVMVFMFFAFSIFAISIAQITGTFFKISSRRREFNEEMAFVRMYLRRIGASQDTQEKVKAYLRHLFDSRQIMDPTKLIHWINDNQPALATQLSLARFGRHLQRLELLKDVDLYKLQPLTQPNDKSGKKPVVEVTNILPGEILCRRREPVKFTWILLQGRLSRADEKGRGAGPCEVVDGDALLPKNLPAGEEPKSGHTIRATTCCSLLRVDKARFLEVVESNHELAMTLLGKSDVAKEKSRYGDFHTPYPNYSINEVTSQMMVGATAAAIHA